MEGDEKSGWFNWEYVKDKSKDIANTYKKDIIEFSSTLASDAKDLVDISLKVTGLDIDEAVGKLEGVAQHYLENESNEEDVRLVEKIHTYIHKPDTYLAARDPVMDEFAEKFNILGRVGDTSIILSKDSKLREVYATLVPSKLTFPEFWMRYYYTVDRIALAEERKKLLDGGSEEKLDWDDPSNSPRLRPERRKTDVDRKEKEKEESKESVEQVEEADDWGDWE